MYRNIFKERNKNHSYPKIEENAENILDMRYYMDLVGGGKEKSFSELCRRVARIVASVETNYSYNNDYVNFIEENIYDDMMNHKFLFNSPGLFSAGIGIATSENKDLLYKENPSRTERELLINSFSKNQMLFACFTLEIPDSLEGIFDSAKKAGIISKFGGGVGANFGNLREKNADISNGACGKSSGPVSFMETWNTMGSVVVQGGKRRSALMAMMYSSHPDIEEFIDCKTEEGKLSYFNISVAIDDKLMEAIKNDAEYELISPYNQKVIKTVKARYLWDKICTNAHKRGDPGIFFIDSANKDSLLCKLKDYKIETSNPCLTGDTLVAVADGRGFVTFKQLSDEGKDVPVYCDDDNGKIVIRTMRNPRITGKNKDLLKITLDSGDTFKCTINHKLFLSNNDIKEAKDLVVGESLAIAKRKLGWVVGEKDNVDKSYIVWEKYNKSPQLEHRMIYSFNYPNEKELDSLASMKYVTKVINNIVHVKKKCENCGEDFFIPFTRREQSYCSMKCCINVDKNWAQGRITRKENYKQNIEYNKIEQLKAYTQLKFEKNKDPEKKEWEDKCKKLGISSALGRTEGRFKTFSELKQNAQIFNHRISKIEYCEPEDVYNGTVDDFHNFYFGGFDVGDGRTSIVLKSLNCGEQPLANATSCNLGSINVSEFVNEGVFDFDEFRDQIFRSIYYLDLVIDASSYPLSEIEERTKNIRPVGLGIMGLADASIKMGIRYGSDNFLVFCDEISKTLAFYSLIASTEIARLKQPFPLWDKEVVEGEESPKNLILRNIKEFYDDRTPVNEISSLIHTIDLARTEDFYDYSHKKYKVTDVSNRIAEFGLRNSRRLSIAPTGSISLILNTSSSIEPNFSYEWVRKITVSSSEKQDLVYKHKLNTEGNKKAGLLVSSHDLTPKQHVDVVKSFAKYCDSGISKTVNLPNSATIEDVKNVYEMCYNEGIKGITVYRDGSRDFQPLSVAKKEEESVALTEEKAVLIKKRPQFMSGVTTKSDSPYGSIYLTANFDNDGNMFETFVSAGKSGSVSKSITEALSRVISLALRANVAVDDIVKTISNISGSEIWVYDTFDGKEIMVKSIPDATAKMLKDINSYYHSLEKKTLKTISNAEEVNKSNDIEEIHGKKCPECNATMVMASGCECCMSCGFSPCK